MANKPPIECSLDCHNNKVTGNRCTVKCQQCSPVHQTQGSTAVQFKQHRTVKVTHSRSDAKHYLSLIHELSAMLDYTNHYDKVPKNYRTKNAANFAKAYVNLKHKLAVAYSVAFTGLVDINKPLSVRECEILYLSAIGLTTDKISDVLSISSNTVKSHFDHIYTKLGVSNRTMAVVWALRHGLI